MQLNIVGNLLTSNVKGFGSRYAIFRFPSITHRVTHTFQGMRMQSKSIPHLSQVRQLNLRFPVAALRHRAPLVSSHRGLIDSIDIGMGNFMIEAPDDGSSRES